jgi:pimeloyl-ACP methyl ester carboxylesterase
MKDSNDSKRRIHRRDLLKGAGHFLQEDAPEQLAALINGQIAEPSDF